MGENYASHNVIIISMQGLETKVSILSQYTIRVTGNN